jgi:hypothetical protein
MANDNPIQVGRLAMRHEGNFWNAYYAMPDSMTDALLLGSIRIQFVETKDRKDTFIALMRDAVADILEEATGVRPTWPDGPQPAPEHERAGHS